MEYSAANTKSGWLVKQGGGVKSWKRRFFVITQYGVLSYYTNETLQEQKGTIPLKDSTIQMLSPTQINKEFAFVISAAGRDFYLCAQDQSERSEWVEVLNEAVGTAVDIVLKEGELTKQGGAVKTWKKRYFRLSPHALTYYKTKQDTKPTGYISLITGVAVSRLNEAEHGKFAFSVQQLSLAKDDTQRAYNLRAESIEGMMEWLRTIQKVVGEEDAVEQQQRFRQTIVQDNSLSPLYAYAHTRDMSGWMVKQGAIRKNWKKRFFILSGCLLSYFASEDDSTPLALNKNITPLGNIPIKQSEVKLEDKKIVIKAHKSKRKYILLVEDDEKRAEWMARLRNAAKSTERDWTHRLSLLEYGDDWDEDGSIADEEDDVEIDVVAPPRMSKMVSNMGNLFNKPKASMFGGSTIERMKSYTSSGAKEAYKVQRELYVSEKSTMEGWIDKLVRKGNKFTSTWHKRYFILQDDTLMYYRSVPKSLSDSTTFKNAFNMAHCTIEEHAHAAANPETAFVLQSLQSAADCTVLSLPTKEEKSAWITALSSAMTLNAEENVEVINVPFIKKGYLSLFSGGLWSRLFFVLQYKQMLVAYSSHHDHNNGRATVKQVCVRGLDLQMLANDSLDRPFCFCLGEGEDSITLSADTGEEKEEWVEVIMELDDEDPPQEQQQQNGTRGTRGQPSTSLALDSDSDADDFAAETF